MTPFDLALCRRTLGVTAVLLAVAWVVVVTTDESVSTTAMRLARLAAIGPALGALAQLVCLEHAQVKGEMRALEALGVAPWKAARGASWAGWLVGSVAVLLVASPWADPSSLFPVVTSSSGWHVVGDRLVDSINAVAIDAKGNLSLLAPPDSVAPVGVPRAWAAALAVGSLALFTPPWAATPMSIGWRATGFILAVAAEVVALHAAGGGLLSAGFLALGALPLVLGTAGGRWATRERLARGT